MRSYRLRVTAVSHPVKQASLVAVAAPSTLWALRCGERAEVLYDDRRIR